MIPITKFHPCQSVAQLNQPGTQQVKDCLVEIVIAKKSLLKTVFGPNRPTPEEFVKFIQSVPNYKPENGDNEGQPLLCALYKLKLYEYIPSLLKMSDRVINRGDVWGWTALFYAILYRAGRKEVLKLIREGADLFSVTTLPKNHLQGHYNGTAVYRVIPAGASPLWVACEFSPSYALLLFKCGASFNSVDGFRNPPLTPFGEANYAEVKERIKKQGESFQKKSAILKELHGDSASYFHLVPIEVLDEVDHCMAWDCQRQEAQKVESKPISLPRKVLTLFK